MCGICGKVGPGLVSEDELRLMTDTLACRGPDDSGMHFEPGVGFGHRRLSIIDLEHGRQPMSNEDGTIWITFNGEIYNYAELRRQLLDRGHVFRTNSDTETIIHLYEETGDACVKHLRGMFAFAIWDGEQRKLLLARDHLGQKPLFYTVHNKQLAFASEIKALLADNPKLAEVNRDALKEYLTIRVISGTRSMFQDVCKLPPAHTLTFQNGKLSLDCYWDLSYLPKDKLSETDLVDALDEQLKEAIRLHLVSDVEVGAFLSGGLDSSLVLAMMSHLIDAPIKAFSVGVPYKRFNELPFARAVSQTCGNVHHFTDTLPASIRPILPEVLWHLDEPSDPLAPCMFHLAKLASRHVKVVLGGDGGDELFGGYDRYYGNRYVAYYAALPKLLREKVLAKLIHRIPDGFWYKSLSHRLRWIHELSFREGGRRYARSLSYFYFPPRWHNEVFGPLLSDCGEMDAEAMISDFFDRASADDLVDRMLYADVKVRLPNHSVMILDRSAMAYGLEARSPLLDHRLAEFAATLPSRLKVRGRSLRYIQTRLAQRYLPAKIIRRPKQGFSSGLPYLMASDFRFLFERYVGDSHLVEAGYLRALPIKRMVNEHLSGHRDHGNRLWLLVNSELWYRMHIEGATVDSLKDELTSSGPMAVAK